MTTKTEESIIEHVRALKEENAAAHDFSLEAIVASARERQESSGRRVIRLTKGEQGGAHQPAARSESKSD